MDRGDLAVAIVIGGMLLSALLVVLVTVLAVELAL
jgi:hypothetical protein